jgi:hypothetical protein
MSILLPQQEFSIPPGVGKSYYEDLTGGKNASVTVNNFGPAPVDLVLTRVNAPVITYVIPAGSSLTLVVNLLLVAALLNHGPGFANGTIQVASAAL